MRWFDRRGGKRGSGASFGGNAYSGGTSGAKETPRAKRWGRRRSFLEPLEERRLLTIETEPNETLATATAFVTPADSLQGTIGSSTDIDTFKATLTQGQSINIRPGSTDIWLGNGADDPGQLHFAPNVRLLDPAGVSVGASADGRDIDFVVPATGVYYVQADSSAAYGLFKGGYSIPVAVTNFAGTTESEPNGTAATADPINGASDSIQGSLSSGTDKDFFSFSGVAGQSVTIKFTGHPTANPTTRLHAPGGAVLATDLTGIGLHFVLTSSGTHTVELRGDNSNGAVTGAYVGQIMVESSPVTELEPVNSFAGAAIWSVTGAITRAIGTLASLTDVDVFAVDFQSLNLYRFQLEGPTGGMSIQSRLIALYNEFGQLLEYSTNGVITSRDPSFDSNVRPEKIGKHFITVRALSDTGLGPYSLSGQVEGTFSSQRDVPLMFQDYTGQTNHLNVNLLSPFSQPTMINNLVGQYEAQYDVYDVDVTLTNPGKGTDTVGFGMGDYEGLYNSGQGSGTAGVRRATGDSILDDIGGVWSTFYDSVPASRGISHEMGHAVGSPHLRNALDYMSYDWQSNISTVGSGFPFPFTDSRVPDVEVLNKRDYLDWSLQAGRIAEEVEPNDTQAQAQGTDGYLAEMTFEMPLKGSFAANNNPHFVTSGDLNGDGKKDLIVANDGIGGVGIMLGNNDGTFGAPTTLTAPADTFGSKRVAVGDLNGDNKQDLVWVNYNDANISVLLGNGDGTFQSAVTYAAGSFPIAVAVSDLNGDGKLDVAVSNGSWNINVLLGNGNGTLQATTQYAAGGYAIGIVAVDLTGDGKPELVTANNTAANVSVFVNNGNGTYQAAVNYGAGPSPWAVAAGDFNGDGKQDIVVSNVGDSTVSLLLGNGLGALAAATQYAVPVNPYSITAGDLNGDGRADAVVTSYHFAGSVSVLTGQANGTLASPLRFAAGFYPVSATIAKLDGDTLSDLAVANYWSHDVTTLLKSGANDPRNDRVVLTGRIASAADIDTFAFSAAAGETWRFDLESAEFQNSLDAAITITDSTGAVLAQNSNARDGDTGLDSVDPFLVYTFPSAGQYFVKVSSEGQSFGDYRLKLTPARAIETAGPRVIAAWPNGGAATPSVKQLVFWFNDQLDPSTLTAANIIVTGNSNGNRTGVATFDPIDSTLTWVADSALPVDTYTVTIKGTASGVKDLHGNRLDGETDGSLNFPEVSGNGAVGGDFTTTFSINATDTTAAAPWLREYRPSPYGRSEFAIHFDDELDVKSVNNAGLTLRGAGPDATLGTSDDTFTPVDLLYDKARAIYDPTLNVYSRGILDSDTYRLEGSFADASGNTVTVSEIFLGPNLAISNDFTTTSDATFVVDVPNGTYDVTVTMGDPVAYQDQTQVTFDDGSTQFLYIWGTRADAIKQRVVVNDGKMTTRFQDFGGQTSFIAVSALDLVKVGGTAFEAHYDMGTASSPVAAGFTKVTESTAYSVGQGYGWSAGTLASDYVPGVSVAGGLDFGASQITQLIHGPVVADLNVQPNSVITANLTGIDVTFSGALNTSTLTTANFQVRYSPNAVMFDGDDVILTEADNAIAWNASLHRATWQPASPFANGYYLIELKGETGGIASPTGQLLDGEYLDSSIAGNTAYSVWRDAPSGDGIPGGDYRAFFTLTAPVAPDIRVQSVTADGATTLTLTYEVADGPVSAFDVGFYRSTDTLFGGDTLLDTVTINAPADLTTGVHVKTYTIGGGANQVALPGAGAAEVAGDYSLLAVADPLNLVTENDADAFNEDNTAPFVGVYKQATGDAFVFGRSVADTITVGGNIQVTLNGVTYTYTASKVTGIRVRGGGGADTIDGGTVNKPMFLYGGSGNDTVTGGAGADQIVGGAGNDSLAGGSGNDTFLFAADSAEGSDSVSDSAGTDTLDFSATTAQAIVLNLGSTSSQVVNGNLTVTLASATAFENVVGGSLADTLTGGTGNNSLTGGPGDDTLAGGAGNDSYKFDADSALGTDSISDSAGTDTLDFSLTTSLAVAVNVGLTTTQVVNSNLSLILASATAFENLIGGSLDDTLTGNTLVNVLTGGPGNDTLAGAGGNDKYQFDVDGPLGSDTLSDSAGTDTLDFSLTTTNAISVDLSNTASQVVHANLSLTLSSATAFENVTGGSLGDTIVGNSLANSLVGGSGNDTLTGGAGDDIYPFDTDLVLGSDTLVESGGGFDTLDFTTTTGQNVAIDLSNAASQVVNANLSLTLSSGSTFEKVIGGGLNDTITGNSLDNILLGGAGADTITGGAGRDLVFAGLGADSLLGGSGDDILLAGTSSWDTNAAKLRSILNIWLGAGDYNSRTTTLRDGTGGVQLKANVTAFNDTNADTLTGNSETDWFFASLADTLTDLVAPELSELLT